ncbi:MAG: class I SAM-dependent methyltransferase [Hyphomicrobiales bacterium]
MNPAQALNQEPIHLDSIYPHSRISDHSRPDLQAIKAKQQVTWSSGDYGQIGSRLQIVGESLAEAVDLLSTEKVIDVAAGSGNASLAAARRFATVVSTDYVPALLEEGRRRAEADGLSITFEQADAEDLPYWDGEFDVALSTYGVMFTPNQERAAHEMLRVVRPGGRIGLANWTPDGFIGRLFDIVSEFLPPSPSLRSPMEWGTETRLVELFGPHAEDIRTERKNYMFRFRSAEHWIDFFRAYYGPTLKAFAALDGTRQTALHGALLELLSKWARPGTGALVVPSSYLEVVIRKQG